MRDIAPEKRPGSRPMEALAWLGIALGLACVASSVHASPARDAYAARVPTPEQITAYTTAICGAVIAMVNTVFVIWHRINPGARKPRKKRTPKRKRDAANPPAAAP